MTKKVINNILVLLIIILSLIVTTYGIFSNKTVYENKSFLTLHEESVVLYGKGLYHNDSISMASQARAQDIITLIIGIPFLIISLFLSNKDSLRGKLLLTGTIGYFLYTYISYSFLMTYNIFFLIYVILMSASLFCFVINITSSEFKNLEKHFKQNFPRKYIGIFAIAGGAFPFFMWTSMILSSFRTVPAVLEHYSTLVIQAMDLGFIVPAAILSGTLLIKNKSLGYLLASIVIIKCTTLLLALTMMIVFMISSGVSVPIIQIIVFPILAIMCIFNLYILLKSIVEIKGQTSA
jgi:hypothetical protein